jgi:hypothetical protein
MKLIGVLTLVLFVAALLSYGPGVPTQNISTDYNVQAVTPNEANNNKLSPTATFSNMRLNPRHGQPGHRCDIAVGQPLDSKPTIPSKLVIPAATILPITPADGLNPKHGQPGHRCDIAVGQPLNSKPPAQTTPTPAIQTTNPLTPLTSTTNTGPAPLLNPKHGQPFHRCDILVGQPLNSKPTLPAVQPKNTAAATTVTPRTNAIVATPAVAPQTNTGAAPLLNPKHGQPGHRCDILVGQPLNGKPPYTLPAK